MKRTNKFYSKLGEYDIAELLHNADVLEKINSKGIKSAETIFYGYQFKSEESFLYLGLRISKEGEIFEGIINAKSSKFYGRLIKEETVIDNY